MASAAPAPLRSLPSDRTIALAIAMVKSKPKDLAVKEYIQLIRQHIVAGRRKEAPSSNDRHVDSAGYWRSQYQRLERSLHSAQGETVDLKMEVERLKEQLKDRRPSTATRKRKQDEDVVQVEQNPKRAKRPSTASQHVTNSGVPGIDSDFSGLGAIGTDLMRSFYQVNSILSTFQKADPELLVHRCVTSASTISTVVREAAQKALQTNAKVHISLKSVLAASSRVILCLIMGFNRLTRVSGGNPIQGRVIYAYVQMFAELVDTLTETAAFQAKSRQACVLPKIQETLNYLTTFLCDILSNLNPEIEGQTALFEGYAYVMLRKIGSSLHTLVFGHVRADSIENEISLSSGHQIGKDRAGNQIETQDVKAAKIEAPFLSQLLRYVLNAAASHLTGPNHSKGGKAKSSKAAELSRGRLNDKARDRLQATLISCMFGPEDAGKDSPLKDCLKMPVMSTTEEVRPLVKGAEVQEWFVEEVWTMLGWEILSRETV